MTSSDGGRLHDVSDAGGITRYWCAPDASVPLDEGYLADSDVFGVHNPALRMIDELGEQQVVALLGEWGLGKTTTLNAYEHRAHASAGEVVRFDLADYGSESLLVTDVFDDPRVEHWRGSEGELRLLLDSFDECKARIPNLGALLVNRLRRCPVERLRLMIVCRTADWPLSLEAELHAVFGDEVGVYELLPLQRDDVRAIADQEGIDGDAFLAAVERSEVTALASRPLTLKLLLRRFHQSGGALPASQAQLYEEGMTWLCGEPNPSWHAAGLTGQLTVAQRLAVAGRLAALTVFSAVAAFWTGLVSGEFPAGDMLVDSCAGGMEPTSRDSFEVTRDAVAEVLRTGLFLSRGGYRLGWAHQSYAEFLAARHLTQRQLPQMQLRGLFAVGADGTVPPQLRGVAAWLVVLAPEHAGFLLDGDPSLLVGTGITAADPVLRARAVDGLLDRARAGRYHHETGRAFRGLGHPGLADQLRPVLTDQTEPLEARQLAVDLAEGGQASHLGPVLAGIALDQGEPGELRVNAGYAVVRIGDDAAKQLLKPLALGAAGADPYDELKGVGLQATWPGGLTVAEALEALTPPKVETLIGAYYMFLHQRFAAALQPGDLPDALVWATRQERADLEGDPRRPADVLHRVISQIALSGWQHLDTPRVAVALAELVIARLRRQPGLRTEIFGSDDQDVLAGDPAKRRRLLAEILDRAPSSEIGFLLRGRQSGLVTRDDFAWLVDRHDATEDPDARGALGQLIGWLFDPVNPAHRDIVFALDRASDLYVEQFAGWFEPIELDSPRAAALRDLQAPLATEGQQGPTAEQLHARIVGLLEAAEAGDSSAWWQCTIVLTGQPGSIQGAGSELDDDLTELPAWQLLSPEEQDRGVDVAARYLLEGSAGQDTWIEGGPLQRPALAGYKAAVLLARRAPDRLEALPSEVWARWAPAVTYYPIVGERDETEMKSRLLRLAYQHASQVVIETLVKLIAKASAGNTGWAERDQVAACWDEPLEQALVGVLEDTNTSDVVFGEVLDLLVEKSAPRGRDLVLSLLDAPARHDTPGRAIRAATILLRHEPLQAWPRIWQLLQQDPMFGRELFLHLAGSEDRRWIAALGAAAMADLYIWLAEQFPPEEDPNVMEAHRVGARERLGHWRDQLLRELAGTGTARAVEGVERITARFPRRPWLGRVLFDAREIASRATWSAVSPDTLLALLADRSKRLLRNTEGLADLLIESLGRLQGQLQGELAQAWALWNEATPDREGRPRNRPKPEERLSGYVAVFLRADLQDRRLVVNREVQVVLRDPRGLGERIDLHVEAFQRDDAGNPCDTLKVPIEVKGCWNKDLFTSMRSQLYGQYMTALGTSHGIYLVGWFDPDDWDSKDRNRSRAISLAKSVVNIEQQLEEQRAELTSEGIMVRPFVLDISLKQQPSS